MVKMKGLGRGLDSLLASGIDAVQDSDRISTVKVSDIEPGVYQPRSQIDDESIQELADSIKEHGIIQPILVRERGLSSYEIVAGERRWRASQLAGLSEVPVIVRSISDENALAIGLIENIQRQNLNPIEEARGFKRLIDEFGLTHENIAKILGRSRSAVTNILRLLSLPEPIQNYLFSRELEMGHARALITLPLIQQLEYAKKAVKNGWSVREIERKVQKKEPQKNKLVDSEYQRLEEEISNFLGMKTKIRANSKNQTGVISFSYDSFVELENLLKHLGFKEIV